MTDGRRHTDSVVVGLASDVGELKGRIKAVEGNVAEIKGDVKTISQDINSLVGQEENA